MTFCGIEAEVEPQHGPEAREQQAGADEQGERDGHLHDGQPAPNEVRAPARGAAATLLAELEVEVHPAQTRSAGATPRQMPTASVIATM